MPKMSRFAAVVATMFLAIAGAGSAVGQTPAPAAAAAPAAEGTTEAKDLGATQAKLMSLLRVSPTLAEVVSSDPALLANQEYVSRSNPELAQFLQLHPEIGRNPAFYLFSNLRDQDQRPYQVLQPRRGFEARYEDRSTGSEKVLREVMPVVAMVLCGGALLWLIRLLLENRRWGKIFTQQSQVHGQLIEKFATSQELLGYMETDAGRRFLEAAPIAAESDQRKMPNVVSRVISTVQIGLVLTLLGIGLLSIRNIVGEGGTAMLVLGMVALMPGIGLILSAGITWLLAKRLNLIREAQTAEAMTPAVDLRDRQ